jgi:hypothetical protein
LGPYRVPLIADITATPISGGYRVSFPGNVNGYVYGGIGGNEQAAQAMESRLGNVQYVDPKLQQLSLPAQDGTEAKDLADLLPSDDTGFAAASYTFQLANQRYDGVGVAFTNPQGTMEVYAQAASTGGARSPDIDAAVLLLLAGVHTQQQT